MGFFDIFNRGTKKREAESSPNQADKPEVEIHSGMRVEVTTPEGQLLFVAKLMYPRGSTAELHQYSETSISEDSEPMPVRIRGYLDHERKAVYMEGTITPRPKHIWLVENLIVARIGNDRAFFRLSTNVDATATTFGGINAGEKPCKLLNISVGGACITSDFPYQEGDKFLLKVKLLEDRDISAIYCQVLRIIDKGNALPEYGCRFLELNESDQARITQSIFTAQRKQRRLS